MITRSQLETEARALRFDSRHVAEVLAHAPAEAIGRLDALGLMLVCPETFRMGLVPDVLDQLESRGLHILAASVVDRYDEELLGRHIPDQVNPGLRWWLIQRRFTSGPTLALLLASPQAAAPLASHLKELKGHRRPEIARPGSLRGSLPAVNGLLNLVHSPDDCATLLRDAEPFFSAAAILDAVTRTHGSDAGLGTREVLDRCVRMYAPERPLSLSFFYVLVVTVHRMVARLRLEDPPWSPALAGLRAAACAAIDDLRKPLHFRAARARFEPHHALLRREYETLLQGLRPAARSGAAPVACLLRLLGEMLRFEAAQEMEWIRLADRLAACGVRLSAWEELVLVSSFLELDPEIVAATRSRE